MSRRWKVIRKRRNLNHDEGFRRAANRARKRYAKWSRRRWHRQIVGTSYGMPQLLHNGRKPRGRQT